VAVWNAANAATVSLDVRAALRKAGEGLGLSAANA